MFATTFSCGFVFADEVEGTADTDSQAITETEESQMDIPEADTQGEPEGNDAENTSESTSEEAGQEPAEDPAEDPAEPEEQSLIVKAIYSETNRTLLKPDADENYVLNTCVSKVRNNKNFTLTIKNPAGCDITLTPQNVASNQGEETSFIEIKSIEVKQSDGESSGDAEGAYQTTEAEVTIHGTGEGYIKYSAAGNDAYLPVSGKITVRQSRCTSIMKRGTAVTSKSVTPKPIRKAYGTGYRNFEIKQQSGVSEFGYKAVQGAGTDGTYSYSALCKNKSSTYVKIVKTRLSDKKVVKVSGNLKLDHANDITYDPVNKRLVVTHNKVHKKRVSFVNPTTLKVIGYHDISVPTTLKGATKSQLAEIGGFASVIYIRDGEYAGCYIAIISSRHNFLVLDEDFKPVEYISVSARYDNSLVYYQGVEVVDDNLYVAVYPRNYKYKNMICVYDMNGDYKGNINLLKGFELENVYHSGSTFYLTFYKPVTKVWYTTKTVKKKVKVKVKVKKKNGKKKYKYKYKYKKVKVKVKHSAKVKRSYIYTMGKVTL